MHIPTNKKVELHNGFFWDCDNCGKENFERAYVPDLPPDVIECTKAAHNIPEDDGHLFFYVPSEVKCRSCGEEYNAHVQNFEGL